MDKQGARDAQVCDPPTKCAAFPYGQLVGEKPTGCQCQAPNSLTNCADAQQSRVVEAKMEHCWPRLVSLFCRGGRRLEGRKTRRSLAKKMGDYGWEIDDGLGQPKELVVGKGKQKVADWTAWKLGEGIELG